MAGGTIGKFGFAGWLHFCMAIQTPTHILTGAGLRRLHRTDFTMAGLAAHTVGHMRPVVEFHKIGLDEDRNPGDRLAGLDVFGQFIQLIRLLGDLLVAAPTFLGRRNSGGGPPGGGRMAINALQPKTDVGGMGKVNRLRGGALGEKNPPADPGNDDYDYDDGNDSRQRTAKDLFNRFHGSSFFRQKSRKFAMTIILFFTA
jgi:hypothetical protein